MPILKLISLQFLGLVVPPYLIQSLGFNLPNAFAGNAENLPHFFQSVRNIIFQAEAHREYFPFPLREIIQYFLDLVFQKRMARELVGAQTLFVFNEVGKRKVILAVADRRFERNDFLGNFLDVVHFLHIHSHFGRDFFRATVRGPIPASVGASSGYIS